MMRAPHLLMVAAVAGAAAFLASLIDNDYYLRILFMMGVYYLCAAGMNVLVGYAGLTRSSRPGSFAGLANDGGTEEDAFDHASQNSRRES